MRMHSFKKRFSFSRGLFFGTLLLVSWFEAGPVLATAGSIEDDVAQAIVQRTNQFRESNGLPPVDRDEALTICAKKFASYMAESGKYGHRADGRTPSQRAEASGYDYCIVRENIAYRAHSGEVTEESLTDVFVSGWIDSPPHRQNMLADYATETGVAVATQDGVTYYAVQLFGRPESSSYQIQVDNAANDIATLVIRSADQKDSIEIGPRQVLKMTRCIPSQFSLQDSQSSVEVSESVSLHIEAGRLQEVEKTRPESASSATLQ